MQPWLDKYPNREMASFLTEGFSSGFKLPMFSGIERSIVNNLKSVYEYPHIRIN